MTVADIFWARVDRRGPDECWPWQRGTDSRGYGRMRVDGKIERAPRIAWWLTWGSWPKESRHRCDNPPCCNPTHLLDGTRTDNMADREARGRTSRGAGHPGAKLTDADVRAMRAAFEAGASANAVARLFGVNSGTAWLVCKRRRWRHVV